MHLLVTLVVLLFAVPIGSVFAAGYAVARPIIGTAGAPALTGNNFSGALTLTYPNGAPITLTVSTVTLRLCSGSTCVTVVATITKTATGTYAYSFTIPSLTGAVTIFLPAGSLTDEYGNAFPSVDTQIGTYAAPSPSAPASESLPAVPTPQQSSPQLMQQAVSQEAQVKQDSPISQLVVALTVLTLGACGLLIFPSRRL